MNPPRNAIFKAAGVVAIFLIVHLAAADVIRVACVGDSITYGYGLRDRHTNLGREFFRQELLAQVKGHTSATEKAICGWFFRTG